MKIASRRIALFRTSPFSWMAVLCIMAGLLVAVALMQFRSMNQINKATEDRIGGTLESLMIDWHLDFYRRFSGICVALQVGPDSGAFDDWSVFRDRYAQWRQTTQTPQLIQSLYIWETSQKTAPRLLSLEGQGDSPKAVTPPSSLGPLLGRLRSRSGNLYYGLRAWESEDTEHATGKPLHRYLPQTSDPLTGWQFEQNIPAIVHPIIHHKIPTRVEEASSAEAIDWIIVVLDMRTIRTQLFPALARSHFGSSRGDDYSLAVAELGNPNRFLFASSADGAGTRIDESDAAMNIFGPPPASVEDSFWVGVKNANAVKVQNWHHFSSPIWFPVIHYSSTDKPWMLILTHRKGRLEDIVAEVRRVNLLTNGVVLLLLAAGVTLVTIAGHRAQSYARLQMDFVASISHELRTPLTAIYSAGENLADGVVEKKSQLQHYGSIITFQARQLINLVDQILTFSSTRSGEKHYEMRPLEVARIIELALQNTQATTQAAGFDVEVEIEAGLPLVTGDQSALASCIQNLLSNAMKYSGKSRWVGVTARLAEGRMDSEIEISVEDRGIGIAAGELTDIFKPFYRSNEVRVAQIHGTGLGLSVAKEIAEAMGGRISVKSALGARTTFTLSLPSAN
jgi:signal transduction histidine kinase